MIRALLVLDVMGICAAHDGTVYLTTLAPFTLHAVRVDRKN